MDYKEARLNQISLGY